ncbi:MAG: hypothetical protein ABIK09_14110 [Pseudomonadota bacterium]
MKRLLALLLTVMFLAVGCKGDDGEVKVKEGTKKKAPSGEDHWGKACDHSIELMKKSDAMRDVPKEQLDKALVGAAKECRAEFRKVGGVEADEAATCVLKLDRFDPKKFSECEPKKRGEKKEEKKEEKK